ncbi:DUF302 domain-containing protein [Terriglobus roseus]|uniref:Uncharacterized conserved protein, DUF302 family n=1 Tax=Terriglobus roseus TaxID=392734 RepID=A0A1G7H6Y0_9BACT|nr:DUF302 domain-containing protein [Terriglobus roseus]SDE96192.1 Uncharacterized conserved protein, DUF302 family [Terriglobus roseus]
MRSLDRPNPSYRSNVIKLIFEGATILESRQKRGLVRGIVGTSHREPNGIMEFARFDLGDVIRKENGTETPRVLRIVAGNPLIMKEMVKHVPDAGSYAPVAILIDERADGIHISYDTMVSHLAPYGNSEALRVATDLDIKIETIMAAAK